MVPAECVITVGSRRMRDHRRSCAHGSRKCVMTALVFDEACTQLDGCFALHELVLTAGLACIVLLLLLLQSYSAPQPPRRHGQLARETPLQYQQTETHQ